MALVDQIGAAAASPGAAGHPELRVEPIRPRVLAVLGRTQGLGALKRRLERGGFEVDAVRSADAAGPLAALGRPDLVLLGAGLAYADGDELLRRLLRRSRDLPPRRRPRAERRYRDLRLDAEQRRASLGGRVVPLSPTEAAVLGLLMRTPERLVSRADLMDRVRPEGGAKDDNILEFFVSQLRRKLEAAGETRLIHTVRGAGYVLRAS